MIDGIRKVEVESKFGSGIGQILVSQILNPQNDQTSQMKQGFETNLQKNKLCRTE